ncbi:polysaccharide lyase family protein [Luteolibacter sp. LG18]|uniref:polysaccharide lyase family protein n=1 Tax=Luteolibacter sp. LG18 TaxID=2819286 RepID=UPI002B2F0509|nr:hypothetical protein llg_05980 [Luteolibacter sp. LG18]
MPLPSFRLLAAFLLMASAALAQSPPVQMTEDARSYTLANGIVTATLDKAKSQVVSLKLAGVDYVDPAKGVYYSMGGGTDYRQPTGAVATVTKNDPELVDIGFRQKWAGKSPSQAVDIEVHYVLKRGESGVHTYAILDHPASYPATGVGEWRMVWGMPKKDKQEWLMEKIRVDALRNWEMPSPADLAVAKPTGIKEIVQVTQGVRAGQFDCKYDFNLEYYSTGCWGHASDKNQVGAFLVLGSHEFFNDGPLKQDLSSASALIHIHFGRNHYDGSSTKLAAGEAWSKLYGPYLLYVNKGGNADALWADARAKAASERKAWPHAWLNHPLYPQDSARGTLAGKFTLHDKLKPALTSGGAWIGLSQPEPGGNWQFESKRFQYWAKVDAAGHFEIPHVRPGSYVLSAFNDGAVGEFEKKDVMVKAGANNAGELVWEVPHAGSSIAWEIGKPDRRATEFRKGQDYFHGYVWTNFSKELPNPLVYTVGKSDPAKDWNFAQGAYMKDGNAVAWPWEVRFDLKDVPATGTAQLVIAWAGSDSGRIQMTVNGDKSIPTFYPPVEGGNALLRESIHAKYSVSRVEIPVKLLKKGPNVLTLTQTKNAGPIPHVMYDYLALEMP